VYLQKYYAGLVILPSNELLSIAKAQALYFRTFDGVAPAICDSGYVLFEDFIIDAIDNIDFDLPAKAHDEAYINKLKLAGLKIVENKNFVTVMPDMDYFFYGFYSYLSPFMKQYMERVNTENRNGFISGDSLIISRRELVSRLIFWDDFYTSSLQQRFVLTDEVLSRRSRYLEALIFGEPNSPVYNADGTVRQDVRDALKKASRGSLKQIIDGYLQILESCNFTKCDKAVFYTW
jgi:hypothetical protein